MGLTKKQIRFCQEYVIDLNCTQAAMRAGYSKRTAYSIGQRLLKNVEVEKEIEKLNKERSSKTGITSEVILSELYRLARADISEAFDKDGVVKSIHEIPEDVRRAISSIEVFEEFAGSGREKVQVGYTKRIKFWDKTKSLELLGKHLKLFVDKIDHSSSDGSMAPKPQSQVIIMLPAEDA